MLAVVLSLVLSAGCTCCSRGDVDDSGKADYVFVFLKSSPNKVERSKEEMTKLQQGHMANIMRLAEEHKLVVAGPYADPRRDPALRGIFLFAVPTVEEARALTDSDPMVQANVLVAEGHPLRSSLVLNDIARLERNLEETAKSEGRPLGMADRMRGYVVLQARDAGQAEDALSDLFEKDKIVIQGRFGGDFAGQGLYVLDAVDLAAANALLEPHRADVGEYTLDPWFATVSLTKLPALERELADI